MNITHTKYVFVNELHASKTHISVWSFCFQFNMLFHRWISLCSKLDKERVTRKELQTTKMLVLLSANTNHFRFVKCINVTMLFHQRSEGS